jgi:hypothetical protein
MTGSVGWQVHDRCSASGRRLRIATVSTRVMPGPR